MVSIGVIQDKLHSSGGRKAIMFAKGGMIG